MFHHAVKLFLVGDASAATVGVCVVFHAFGAVGIARFTIVFVAEKIAQLIGQGLEAVLWLRRQFVAWRCGCRCGCGGGCGGGRGLLLLDFGAAVLCVGGAGHEKTNQ